MHDGKGQNTVLQIISRIQVGIGDLATITGISQRQLRYWEQRGYIEPLRQDNRHTRCYDLKMIIRCGKIKDYLDQGYTLAAAIEKTDDDEAKMDFLRHFYTGRDEDLEIELTDKTHNYGRIAFGKLENGDRLIGIIDETGRHFTVESVQKTDD